MLLLLRPNKILSLILLSINDLLQTEVISNLAARFFNPVKALINILFFLLVLMVKCEYFHYGISLWKKLSESKKRLLFVLLG